MIYALVAVFAALQLADIYTTSRILAGGGVELNPVLSRLFASFDVLSTLAVMKVAAVALVWAFLQPWPLAIAGLDVLYAVVVWNNWRQMRR